ncbi:hypothetical protein TGPRC2_214510 [Toxoplasma gondii TgCatPRC2]|uniref:Uncharacterized protein n=1 Tax=Toxoplasma gondii TgCatPRC2 TaxID=1130821 RepID=A0A151HF07_TOXGO|nr:hypothetical protein TGPRC2_214510 [Toxoplasma gondii TgCatPRC2]
MIKESVFSISQEAGSPARGLLGAKMLVFPKKRNSKNVCFPQVSRLIKVLLILYSCSTFYVGTLSKRHPHAVPVFATEEAPEKTHETEARTGLAEVEIHQQESDLPKNDRDDEKQIKEGANEDVSPHFLGAKEPKTIAPKEDSGHAGQSEGEIISSINFQIEAPSADRLEQSQESSPLLTTEAEVREATKQIERVTGTRGNRHSPSSPAISSPFPAGPNSSSSPTPTAIPLDTSVSPQNETQVLAHSGNSSMSRSASSTNKGNEEKVSLILDELLTQDQKKQLPAYYLDALRSYLSGLSNEEVEQLLAYDAAIRAKASEDALTQYVSSELSNQANRDPLVENKSGIQQPGIPPALQHANASSALYAPTADGRDEGTSAAVDSPKLPASSSPLFNNTWVDMHGNAPAFPQMPAPEGFSQNEGPHQHPVDLVFTLPQTLSYGSLFPLDPNDKAWTALYPSVPSFPGAPPSPPLTDMQNGQVPAVLQPLELQPLVPLQLGSVALPLSPAGLLFGNGYSRTSPNFPGQAPPPARNAALLSPLTGVVDGVLRAATTGVVAPAVVNAGLLLHNANQISARVQEGSEQASQFIEGYTAYRHSNPDDPLAKLVNVLEEAATSLNAKGGLEAEAVGMQNHSTSGALVEGQEARSKRETGTSKNHAANAAVLLLETGGEGEGRSGSQGGINMQGVEYQLTNKADPFDFSDFASAAGVSEAKQRQAKEEQRLRNAKKSEEPANVISNVIGTGFDVAVDVLSRHQQQQERQRQRMQSGSDLWALPYGRSAGSLQQTPQSAAGDKPPDHTAGTQHYGYYAGYNGRGYPLGDTAENFQNGFTAVEPHPYSHTYSVVPPYVALTQSVAAGNPAPEYASGGFLQYHSPAGPITTSSGNYAYPLMTAYAHQMSGMSAS